MIYEFYESFLSKCYLQIGQFHERISRLQSSFEKNELLHQKLEYELALSQQEVNAEKKHRKEDTTLYNKQLSTQQGKETYAL